MEDDSSRAAEELYCPECGYDLRGGMSGRCPECGVELDEESLRRPRIPWVRRGKVGLWRAYRQTVWTVLVRPGRVGGEVGKPLEEEDARLFRRVTVWIATLPIVGLAAGWYGVYVQPIERWVGVISLVGGVFEWLVLVAVAAGAWLFLYAMTGVGSFFFRPAYLSAERRSRAVAASDYGSAVLALIPVVLPMTLIGWFILTGWEDVWRYPVVRWASWGAVALPGVVLIWMCVSLLAILKRATNCGVGREVAMGVLLPVSWVMLAGVVLVGIPAAVGYVGLMVLSFL